MLMLVVYPSVVQSGHYYSLGALRSPGCLVVLKSCGRVCPVQLLGTVAGFPVGDMVSALV